MIRLLVCGSRDWNDQDILDGWLTEIWNVIRIECVIEGEQRGADLMSRNWAERHGYSVEAGTLLPFPADWSPKEGKPIKYRADGTPYDPSAGPARNEKMLREGHPTLVVGFPLPSSRGTWHMLKIAREAGITTWQWPKDRHAITALGEGVFA